MVLCSLAALAGCGEEEGGAGAETRLKVGVIPIADVAPLYLGREKGFFRAERLSVEPQLAEGGAAIAPAVLGGDFQFGYSNTISLLIAASKKLPVRIVTQGTLGGRRRSQAWADLLVRRDGPVRSVRDLEGRTIAVNTLNNICEVTIKASLEKRGVDVSKLRFTEVPFPEMNAALEAGRVDGACGIEPFVTEGEDGAARGIDPFYVNTAPDLTIATYFTSASYLERNRDVVRRFARAMNRSLEYARAHPDEARRVLSEYTQIPPRVAERIKLPVWRTDLNRPTIELLARLSRRYGLIRSEPRLDELIARP